MEKAYLCGYLKISGLTEEFPTLTTFFDGEIISKKHPFLTRKWDADEDVDRKHWVSKAQTVCFILKSLPGAAQQEQLSETPLWADALARYMVTRKTLRVKRFATCPASQISPHNLAGHGHCCRLYL